MQEQENKKDTPMVDIDTSGPGEEIELKDDSQTEEQVETKEQDTSPEIKVTQDEKPEAQANEEKKDELENYSKDVQRRIAKLTGKWREAQRQRDEAIEFAKAQKEQREALSKKYSSVEQAGVKDREERIKAGLIAAQAKITAAREEGNIAAEIEAQKEIASLGYQESRLQEAKLEAEQVAKVETKAEQMPAFNQPAKPQQQVDPKAESWGAENKWFGTDNAMTYTAFDIHNKLESEGYDPQSDEYYAEIDKRIRLEFPHKFDKPVERTTSKPTQTVASATRSPKTSRKSVKLTPSQVAIAKKLGVPLEEYAKQLINTKEV